jgi:phosphoglycolate phosphatase
MRYRTVLFDLDGTLIDHFAAIHRSHAYAMNQLGLPVPTLAQVRAAVGGGLEQAIARIAGPANVAAVLAVYRPYWNATMLDDVQLLPGAREILTTLKQAGIRSAVFTNKHGPSSRRICEHLGIADLLAGNFGATDTAWLKPERAFADHVITALQADPKSTALVGDSPFDVAAAKNAGFGFFGVTTGTHTADELRAAGGERVFAALGPIT